MADNSKLKLVLGFSFIAVAFICVVAVLYFIGDVNKKSREKSLSLEVQLANLIAEKSQTELDPSDAKRTRREPARLEDALTRAESLYGTDELNRKEGVLWLDRKATVAVVTLGTVNGLKPGSRLNVYDGDTLIDKVVIVKCFDIISYARLFEKPLSQFDKDYYRVAVENE